MSDKQVSSVTIVEELIEGVVSLTLRSIADHQKSAHNISLETFEEEFCTSTLLLPRRVGKSEALLNYCNQNPKKKIMIITSESLEQLKGPYPENVKLFGREKSFEKFRGYSVDVVFVIGQEAKMGRYDTAVINVN
jgi:hypothetical protein